MMTYLEAAATLVRMYAELCVYGGSLDKQYAEAVALACAALSHAMEVTINEQN